VKLKTLKSTLQTLRPGIQTLTHRPDVTPRLRGRAGVERRARWLCLHPLCLHCEQQGRTTVAITPDHITPLENGGADDETNLQSLCKACHDIKTAAEATERATRVRRL
jgi:5-methylcytosine-specific restriction protein A